MEEKYLHNYDNPYRMLAASIAIRLSTPDAKRILKDSSYVKQLVLAEVRDNIDIPGMFADCVTTELLSESQKVLYRTALNELGLFFYKQLDLPRLRSEIRKFYEELGISLD